MCRSSKAICAVARFAEWHGEVHCAIRDLELRVLSFGCRATLWRRNRLALKVRLIVRAWVRMHIRTESRRPGTKERSEGEVRCAVWRRNSVRDGVRGTINLTLRLLFLAFQVTVFCRIYKQHKRPHHGYLERCVRRPKLAHIEPFVFASSAKCYTRWKQLPIINSDLWSYFQVFTVF